MQKLIKFALVAVLALGVIPAWAQYAPIHGSVIGIDGKPMPDAKVEFVAPDTGRAVDLKTDKGGKFQAIGVEPGIYQVTLITPQGQKIELGKRSVTFEEDKNHFDFNLAQMQQKAQQEMPEAERKRIEQAQKEQQKIRGLNQILAQADAAQKAGNPQQAIELLNQAVTTDPTHPLLFARLADAYDGAKNYDQAAANFQKAIDLAKTTNRENSALGSWYNNLGGALGKQGKVEDAIKAYDQAVQTDPPNAAQYYYNEGVTFFNAGKVDESIAALDKAIAANPSKPETYYLKGNAMMNKATMKGDKVVAPPGTEEAFQKYLELAPTGPYAEAAKASLQALGSSVQTTYKAGKKSKPKD